MWKLWNLSAANPILKPTVCRDNPLKHQKESRATNQVPTHTAVTQLLISKNTNAWSSHEPAEVHLISPTQLESWSKWKNQSKAVLLLTWPPCRHFGNSAWFSRCLVTLFSPLKLVRLSFFLWQRLFCNYQLHREAALVSVASLPLSLKN